VSSTRAGITPVGLHTNTGPIATAAWLVERELFPSEPHWFVEVVLTAGDSRLRLELYAEEWGFLFSHDGRTSWIRVTDVPFVHGHDDHKLLHRTPPLKGIGKLVRHIEQQHGLAFSRTRAAVRTNVRGGERPVRAWIATL
jgi:hypothetical protein